MDAAEQFRRAVLEGQIGLETLLDLIAALQQQLAAARREIAELKKQIPPSKPEPPQDYSLDGEAKRQLKRKKQKSNRRGRRGNLEKIKLAKRTEPVYPDGLPRERCKYSHTRVVWQLEDGKAVLVAYDVYRGPNKQYGQIPGVRGRSEFSQAIVVEVAHLVYVVGLSFDKVAGVLQFVQQLPLGKSQIDAMLHRLAREWEQEFENLCVLLAHSLIVHADETSWSIKSVWALLSEQARVIAFGVNKDAETLKKLLDPATFDGLVISDHAAVYDAFTDTQKCWAHLIRKAIKLTLTDPEDAEYRALTDQLLTIYQASRRAQADGRLSDAGRARRVEELEAELLDLLWPRWGETKDQAVGVGPENDYRLLINELFGLLMDHALFRFVTTAPAEQPNGEIKPASGTNNESERTLREPAMARKTGRTNKTTRGARRQTILVSVLQSLRVYLPTYTLASVVTEVTRWWATGVSCFRRSMQKLGLPPPENSVLDNLFHPAAA